ncbi:hypothetical protein MXD59_07555 [Frankia sp. Ag45/Mut15]|uniref:Uncharacterized protein n=1 Tax=Frankia umida TaxID=573489 RepID=A0ABT0JVQ0_9ACTN|nr:hypothetical protein [Frankia umida]MCK9875626.1 hypothetical protein [Frankia umida]
MGRPGRSDDEQWPGSDALLRTLVSGLSQEEQDETLRLLRRRLAEDRAAATGGQRDRQVDVGPRSRVARGGTPSGQ